MHLHMCFDWDRLGVGQGSKRLIDAPLLGDGGKRMSRVEFTIAEVMELCGVGRRMVLTWIAEEKLPGTHFLYDSPKLGHRIPARALLAFVERTNPMATGKIERAIAAKEHELGMAS